MNQYLKKMKWILVGTMALVGVSGLAGLVALWGPGGFLSSGPNSEDLTIIIEKGSLPQTAQKLHDIGAVEHPWLFMLGAVASGKASQIKAGEYLIPAGARPGDILNILCSGKVIVHKVTIPEGYTVKQIVDLLNELPHLTGEVVELPKEGELLPDTYSYVHGDHRAVIIKRMKAAMDETLQEVWKKRREDLPIKTPEEALILASIVEKETGKASERPRIAGVFCRRLQLDMKLESDPTVIYALTLGEGSLKRSLTKKDLRYESPYNTYFAKGLPPTPIACPGRKALEAVVKPMKTKELFFVADGTGGHNFSTNYTDHSAHVNTWRQIRDAKK